jgi:hypothetical protein
MGKYRLRYFHKIKHNIFGDIIEVKVKDGSRKTLYKGKCNSNNTRALAKIIKDLEKYGIDSVAMLEWILEEKKSERGWFNK